ncbi:MAG: DOMON-like domain-containing protein, partial [Burkholderiales bacterium]|nr:DOMON-like domain-containing protein [Burkholderiales bacterium]
MPSSANHVRTLVRHPDTSSDAVRGIAASVTKLPGGVLALNYVIEGDLDSLRIPAPRPPAPGERLWQHTCCEVFIARKEVSAYHEFNFAPTGEWAAYAFARYREGAPLVDAALDPRIAVHQTRERLELDAFIPLALLSPEYADAELRLALAAVIEDAAGVLSYWALR